jgi:hypothetical protein
MLHFNVSMLSTQRDNLNNLGRKFKDFRPQTCTNCLVFRECKHIRNIFEDVYFTKNVNSWAHVLFWFWRKLNFLQFLLCKEIISCMFEMYILIIIYTVCTCDTLVPTRILNSEISWFCFDSPKWDIPSHTCFVKTMAAN